MFSMLMLPAGWSNLALDAVVLVLAAALDRLLPEPPARVHPVVWIGRAISILERAAPRRHGAALLYGCLVVAAVVGVSGLLAWLLMVALVSLGSLAYAIGGAVLLRTTFTVAGLSAAAGQTRQALAEGRLDDARTTLRSLVSRDATSLTSPLVAASAIESVAENTTDSYVAPWLAFAAFGVPGAVAYRAVNTLDSMLGRRGAYEYLGKAAARLDDVVNLLPARVSAVLLLMGGTVSGHPARRGWRIMLRDRGRTASPNAGLTMSAMAGLLGRRLEKQGHYVLGEEMPEPEPGDIALSGRIVERTAVLALLVAFALLAVRHGITG